MTESVSSGWVSAMYRRVRDAWITALRSDHYRQGFKGLTHISLRTKVRSDCGLGVLCDLAVQEGIISPPEQTSGFLMYGNGECASVTYLPPEVIEWAGIFSDGWGKDPFLKPGDGISYRASAINDSGEYDLKAIADLIERYVEPIEKVDSNE